MMSILSRLRQRDHAAAPAAATYRSATRSHVGLVRAVNEDRAVERADRQLWAVADGMGGHSAGDVAAQTVAEALRKLLDETAPVADSDIVLALQAANAAICRRNDQNGTNSGTTVVVAHIVGDALSVFWVGDSRAYLVRDGRAEQLTRDHSVVQAMVDAGLLTAAAAERHPQANVVTRALGVDAQAEIDSVRVALLPGDRILLCSDGLSRSLRAEDLSGEDASAETIVDRLLANALQRDGSDNITLIAVECAGLPGNDS